MATTINPINESVEEKVCANCDEKVDDDFEENEYDGEYYCDECLREFTYCEECLNPVPDGVEMFGDDLLYCPNCEDCLEEDEEDEEDKEEQPKQ